MSTATQPQPLSYNQKDFPFRPTLDLVINRLKPIADDLKQVVSRLEIQLRENAQRPISDDFFEKERLMSELAVASPLLVRINSAIQGDMTGL